MKESAATYFEAILILLMVCAGIQPVGAQEFSVSSFRVLPNDVTAFINPVQDRNGEDCGLIKVMAPDDFVFSTPLGIVKREDKVGEIWLYVPHGTKKITIKHSQWGVLRDYILPSRISSHITAELVIASPVTAKAETVTPVVPVVKTVVDTVVMTRVDTVMVLPRTVPVPLTSEVFLMAEAGGKSTVAAGGIMVAIMKRHGGFVHLSSNFGKVGEGIGECDKEGLIAGELPFYSGAARKSFFMVNAGAAHRLSQRVAIFEGIGFGDNKLAWELAPSEGGGWVTNRGYSCRGVSLEAGAILTFNRLVVSASVASIKGRDWYGCIGVGIKLGKL